MTGRAGVRPGCGAAEGPPPRPEAPDPSRAELLSGPTGPPRASRLPKRRRRGMAARGEGA
ncbi:hypothetical protein GCM10022206_83780 [Streptomyces chiangmaiensis]